MNPKKENILKKIYELGFDDIGIASLDDIPDQREELENFLTGGFHGDMIWLEKNKDRRSHPSKTTITTRVAPIPNACTWTACSFA